MRKVNSLEVAAPKATPGETPKTNQGQCSNIVDLVESSLLPAKGEAQAFKEAISSGQAAGDALGEAPKGDEADVGRTSRDDGEPHSRRGQRKFLSPFRHSSRAFE